MKITEYCYLILSTLQVTFLNKLKVPELLLPEEKLYLLHCQGIDPKISLEKEWMYILSYALKYKLIAKIKNDHFLALD